MQSPLRLRWAANLAWQIAALVAIALAVAALRPGEVSGVSMEPLIASDELVFINAIAYRFGAPARGEIVAFRHDGATRETYIKRVIGIAGDRIAIDRGTVVLDGKRLDEPYVRFRDGRSFPEVVVPPGKLYVLGDNRARSEDSRAWGFVSLDAVAGRASFGVWPLARVGRLR